jgi:hypothetical protein
MNRKSLTIRLMLSCVMALMAASQTRAAFAAPPVGDAVTVWNANSGVADCGLHSPFHESRIYAMMHVAIHDALNAIHRRYRPYTFDMQEPGASPDAAVASAARDVCQAHRSAPF